MRRLAAVLCCAMALGWAGCGASNNGKISYLTIDSNNKTTVNTISSDGKTTKQVQIDVPADAWFVQPNRTATEVAYCRYDANDNLEIYLMGLDNQEKQLTHFDTDGQNCYPAFSHDSDTIVFNSDRDGSNIQIYSMNADGTNQKHLITSETEDIFPKYSPDDASICFIRYGTAGVTSNSALTISGLKAAMTQRPMARSTTGTKPKSKLKASLSTSGDGLYIAKSDGTNPKLVLANDSFSFYSVPVFSNDGKHLLFATGQFNEFSQIGSVKLDGTGLTNLSNSHADDYAPFPYGSRILFNRYQNSQVDIWIMDGDGKNQKALTNTTDTDEYLPDYESFL